MRFLFFVLTLLTSSAFAGTPVFYFNIDGADYSDLTANGATVSEVNALKAALREFENEIQDEIGDVDSGNYLQYSSESSVMAGSPVSSDYANNFDKFIFGVGLGVGVNTPDSISDIVSDEDNLSDPQGFGIQAAAMVGFNFGSVKKWRNKKILGLHLSRLQLMINFLSYDFNRDSNDGESLDAEILTLGFKLRYLLIPGKSFGLPYVFRWEGVHVHTGLQYNSFELTYSAPVNEGFSETTGGQTYTGTFNSIGTVSAEISSLTVPLEISSAVRLLYFFTFYGGLGANINTGAGEGSARLSNAQLVINRSGGGTATVNAVANLGEDQKPDIFLTRLFTGLQFNFAPVKLGVEYSKGLGNDNHGAGVYFRFAW